ncbi:MAG: Fic family protein [Bacteroidales bacterium]|nr:Fic family protein [Bacteroidales bacterium]MDD3431559.1 Fic family protein [Bacteroidales bacterium]MDD4362026.1 Fic family protein [Bacteroidales bacterium]
MKPPYTITPLILRCVSSISEKIGQVNAGTFRRPPASWRKRNALLKVHASLRLEGNKMSLRQIKAVLEQKQIKADPLEMLEAQHALKVYDELSLMDPFSLKDFLKTHKMLMNGLEELPGKFRNREVGIVHGDNVAHIAPPAKKLTYLMQDLFRYLKDSEDPMLIKSCVFFYETEFIHPFLDGNGRLGRLWCGLLLSRINSLFMYIPLEQYLLESRHDYYKALAISDSKGASTAFVEYLLQKIEQALNDFLQERRVLSKNNHIYEEHKKNEESQKA